MKKLLLAMAMVCVMVALSGCKCHSGSREYAPGKGWYEN